MIKLIMSDMDGTLLDENGCLPEEFDEVMAELRERHVMFAPASGRQYFALLHQFRKYRDDFIFLAENGAFVLYHEIEIFSNIMEPETARAVLEQAAALEPQGIYPVLCGKKGAYVKSRYQPFLDEMTKYYTQYSFVDDFADVDDDVIKISICDAVAADAENTIYPIMKSFEGALQTPVSSNYWVDIMNADINKGLAIQQIQKTLGLLPEECAAFGDYLNDLQMMQSVYYSFAMENAHPAIKEAARFQARSNKDHGVLLAIRDFISQKLI